MRAGTIQVNKKDVMQLKAGMKLEDAIANYIGLPKQVLDVQQLTSMEYRVAMTEPFSGNRVENIGTVVEIGRNQYVFQPGENYDLVSYDLVK